MRRTDADYDFHFFRPVSGLSAPSTSGEATEAEAVVAEVNFVEKWIATRYPKRVSLTADAEKGLPIVLWGNDNRVRTYCAGLQPENNGLSPASLLKCLSL
jgi:hypothetical protein